MIKVRAALLFLCAILCAACGAAGQGIYWSDGDSGRLPDGTKFRLFSVDAPETGGVGSRYGAKCEAERELGYEAKAVAVEFTRGKAITWELIGHQTWGRETVRLFADGEDVGAWVVANGPAKRWRHTPGGKAIEDRPEWCG